MSTLTFTWKTSDQSATSLIRSFSRNPSPILPSTPINPQNNSLHQLTISHIPEIPLPLYHQIWIALPLSLRFTICYLKGRPSPVDPQWIILHIPIYFHKIYNFPLFSFNLRVLGSPILTKMHLRIILYTYLTLHGYLLLHNLQSYYLPAD